MSKLFISHTSKDDEFVRRLREALADFDLDGWIDSRELRGGDLLWSTIRSAIEAADGFAFVVSAASLQSEWVSDELAHALKIQQKRGPKDFPVIPLLLNGARLGAFKSQFPEEPLHISIANTPTGIAAGINDILVAMGKRDPADTEPRPQPPADPLEELVLELTDLKFHETDGVRRASARARLVYEPAAVGARDIHSAKSWRFTAPIGPIEAEELRWYLEKFAIWPSGVPVIQDRARKVEENLVDWGKLLHEAALPLKNVANVLQAWAGIGDAGRRFSVHVDAELEDGAPEEEVAAAKEAATLLLGLPWELLHDGDGFLFQSAKPTRVRRRLPNTRVLEVPVVAAPIRILLVTARPEDDACGYIDHRVSALPLVEAMESLPGQVQIHVLNPPTFPSLRAELERARAAGRPYHVVHFDGHGVYDHTVGLGGLCFEDPADIDKLDERRHVTVFTKDLGPLLRDLRIPLVFLEACQTAQAAKASESVASELLKVGVASVVAMSHSVLVETARIFVEAFYQALAEGKRVGDAMLAGQKRLREDTRRGRIFGAAELRLEDWFVPVLYQEKDDPQLFTSTPAQRTLEDFNTGLARRLGDLPTAPESGFVGRSRELLGLQRLLQESKYAIIRGQGGEGKSVLAAEFARWTVRSQQARRAAFVSVETHRNQRAVADALGKQLIGPNFTAAGDLEDAVLKIERVLREQSTLLVADNMESVLLPPFVQADTPAALADDVGRELQNILSLFERILGAGDTRLVFTSREGLPEPFAVKLQHLELTRLHQEDAVKLVERVVNTERTEELAKLEAAREEIERLIDTACGHAQTLSLLAPALQQRGVDATRESLVELMADMERRFPGSREQSLFAGVELSLQRLSPANRERAQVLGVFHAGIQLGVLETMMKWNTSDVGSLAVDLVATGLATHNRYNHLTLHPALGPYLRNHMTQKSSSSGESESDTLNARWVKAMIGYVELLRQQQSRDTKIAATLTALDLPNLFALLECVEHGGDPEATISLTSSLYSLLQALGKAHLVERVGQARDKARETLDSHIANWNKARFRAFQTRVEQQLTKGQVREALHGAQALFQSAHSAGERAYSTADYDIATAHFLLARVLRASGSSDRASALLDEAQERFRTIAKIRNDRAAEAMSATCLEERGNCLRDLGRFDEATVAYEQRIRSAEKLQDVRGIAIGKLQLGTLRMFQLRYDQALAAYKEARERFTELNEPSTISGIWHQTGMVYEKAGEPEMAENAYRNALAVSLQVGDDAGRVRTLAQLGSLYNHLLNRPEEAAAIFRQALDQSAIIDTPTEGAIRNNLAVALRKLSRLNEARQEIHRAIACKAKTGHVSSPWNSWSILREIELDAGNAAAAEEAGRETVDAYLAYRRDGGENPSDSAHLARDVTRALISADAGKASSLVQQESDRFEAAGAGTFTRALLAIIAGSRDNTLATPDMHFELAGEILYLLETLEKHEHPRDP